MLCGYRILEQKLCTRQTQQVGPTVAENYLLGLEAIEGSVA